MRSPLPMTPTRSSLLMATFVALSVGCECGCGGSSLPAAGETGDCTACHVNEAAAFSLSRHSSAGDSAVFVALRARAGSGANFCDLCHRPDSGNGHGLSCLSCHAAIGNRERQNGRLVQELGAPIQVGDDTGLNAPHQVQSSGFLRSADLCATCHDVNGPGAFHEQPFESWESSAAAQQGLTCQACHLSPNAGRSDARPVGSVARGAPANRPLADHRFIGLGSAADSANALLENGLTLSWSAASSNDVGVHAQLTVQSTTQGHHLLSGAAFIREVVVLVESLDANGNATTLSSVSLAAQPTSNGAPTPDPLSANGVNDQGLAPDQERSWSIDGPLGTKQLRACLAWRTASAELTDWLGVDESPQQRAGCVEIAPP
jgi:hypothetical protein